MRETSSFRFLVGGHGHPFLNMAVDEVLFRRCLDGRPPFLRLYLWRPPGLSLGHFQKNYRGIGLDFCEGAGIPVVRRLTGGRAVLHHREITYSLASPFVAPFDDKGVLQTYTKISRALSSALSLLGADTKAAGRRKEGQQRSPNCFAAPSLRELTWRGRKLVGSAQVRDMRGFLQHGSILTGLDSDLWKKIFPADGSEAGWGVGLEEILGREVGMNEFASAAREAFREVLSIELKEDELTEEEILEARNLAEEKYSRPFGRWPRDRSNLVI